MGGVGIGYSTTGIGTPQNGALISGPVGIGFTNTSGMTSIGNTNASLLVNGGVGIGYSTSQNVLQYGAAIKGPVSIGLGTATTSIGLNTSLLVNGGMGIGFPNTAGVATPPNGALISGPVGIGFTNTSGMTSIGNTNASLLVNGGVGIGYSSTTQTQNVPQGGLIVNGTVGIGTTNPSYAGLDIYGSQKNLTLRTDGYPAFQFFNYGHGNQALLFDAYYNSAWYSSNANANFAIYNVNNSLYFKYNNGIAVGNTIPAWASASGNVAMTISNSGKVGISTTNPSDLLTIDAAGSGSGTWMNLMSSTDATAGMVFNIGSSTNSISTPPLSDLLLQTGSRQSIRLDHQAGSIDLNASYIACGGNVGINIGITNPTAALEVNGDINAIGKVGIGTTNPSDLLTVDNASSGGNWMHLMSSTDATAGMTFSGGSGYNSLMAPYNSDLILLTQSRQSIQLDHQNNSVDLNAGSILLNAPVSINTGNNPTPGVDLDVAGTIKAMSVKIGNWTLKAPDYVFDKGYKLPLLKDLEKKIIAEKHLPGLPSAAEMKKNGVDLGEINMALLKKVEELTLYVIDQNKKIEKLEKEIAKKN